MSADTIRKSVTVTNPISPTTVYGWPAVIFSLPFIGIGGFIVLLALGVIPSDDASFHASRHVVAGFGALFFFAGVMVLVHGLNSLREAESRRELLKKYPLQKWMTDYRWNPKGMNGDDTDKIRKVLGGAVGMAVFLIPFHWFAFSDNDLPSLFFIIFGLFDCVILGYLGFGIYLLLRLVKYGKSFLQFDQFPFFLGEGVGATLNTKAIPGLKDMTVTLRCIEEQYEVRGSGKNRSVQVVSYQIYGDTLKFENMGGAQSTRCYLPVNFSLPTGNQYETALSARPAKYWKIEFQAQTPGIDFSTAFLLPVYARNGQ